MRRYLFALIAALLAALFISVPVYAAEGAGGSIPIYIEEDGSGETYSIKIQPMSEEQDPFMIAVKEGENGAFDFYEEEPGIYEYQISEVPGTKKDVTYDKTVYTLFITVVSEEDGLASVISVNRNTDDTKTEKIIFQNKRTETKEILKDVPRTGDNSSIMGWTAVLSLSFVGILFLLWLMKKQNSGIRRGGDRS